jgi:tetratricopeptide (TPR) repeat protein
MVVSNDRHLRSRQPVFLPSASIAGSPYFKTIHTECAGTIIPPSPRTNGKNRKIRRAEKRKSGGNTGLVAESRQDRPEPASILDRVASLFSDAVRCHQSGQLAEAIALSDRILSLKPDLPEVHCNRGVALAALGRLGDAEAAYRQAIALNVNFADAYNNLGVVLWELGRLDDAERALRQAVTLKPDWPQCHTNFGNVLKSQGKFADAEAAHRQAIVLYPDFSDAYKRSCGV